MENSELTHAEPGREKFAGYLISDFPMIRVRRRESCVELSLTFNLTQFPLFNLTSLFEPDDDQNF